MKTYLLLFFSLFFFSNAFAQDITNDKDPKVWMERAGIAQKTNDLNLAFSCVEKAIKLDSTNVNYYHYAGGLLSMLGKKDKNELTLLKSINMHQKANDILPDNAIILCDLGTAYFRLGKINKVKEYEREIELYCLNSSKLGNNAANYNLACYYSCANKKKDAFKYLEECMIKNKKGNYIFFNRKSFENDSDFDTIRKDKKLKQLLDKYLLY